MLRNFLFKNCFLGLILFCGVAVTAVGQDAGAYSFLELPTSARGAALGGVNVSNHDRDVNFLFSSPALMGDTLNGVASAGYQFFVADIGHASFSYAHDFHRIGVIGFGIQHLSYGKLKSYDASGQEIADFDASSTALVITKTHALGNFRMGGSFKFAFSDFAGFRSSAAMIDVGGIFIHPDKQLTVGIAFRNFGVVLGDFTTTSNTELPFDVQAGVTFKPEHMPIRFSLTAFDLTRRDYADRLGIKSSSLGKVFRHFNFGTEILVHRNFNFLLGYNYRIHQELKLANGGGIAGVSLGIMARVKTFELVISRSAYVVGNAGYGFTLSANVDKMLTRN